MTSDAEAKATQRPQFLLIGLVAICMFLPGTEDSFSEESSPARITQEVYDASTGTRPLAPPPSLRGCCGTPTNFHWVFLGAADAATAGSAFPTRIFALDAQGRQARPSACGELRVDMGLSGRARLSQASSLRAWKNAELRLDIETDIAEVVEAEVRIESPNSNADVLLHTSQIRFSSGPPYTYSLQVRRSSSQSLGVGQPESGSTSSRFPCSEYFEVIVSTYDRFGNLAKGVRRYQDNLAGTLYVRSNVALSELNFMPASGRLQLDTNGEARASMRSTTARMVHLWLEQPENITQKDQQLLRDRSLKKLEFVQPPKPPSSGVASSSAEDSKWQHVADEVRQAFRHAWEGYKKHAWGRDELQPLSKSGRDSFGGIGITILDSLTTLWLLGLEKEFDEAASFVENTLDYDNADNDVSVFELIIRALGGLLGAHSLSGRNIFLKRAEELADRLLPALNTASNLPMPKWNIARGVGPASAEPTILAEAGSMQLEFRYLSKHIGDDRFRKAGDAALDAVRKTGVTGLAPVYLTPPDHAKPRALASKFAVGALADSYYEYLLKLWIQDPRETRFKDAWLAVLDEIPGLMRPKLSGARGTGKLKPGEENTQFKLLEIAPGGDPIWNMDHLSCFAPGMISLGLKTLPKSDLKAKSRNSTWWPVVDGLVASCVKLWTSTKSGLAPEFAPVNPEPPFDFKETPSRGVHSFLRPETAESLFYLYRFTGDEKYRKFGEKLFRAMISHAKVDAGFASVKNVNSVPTTKLDEMQSFVMAETFKYLFLLFSPASVLDLDQFVLNTEGHPLRRFAMS